jgi:hypothetical protein
MREDGVVVKDEATKKILQKYALDYGRPREVLDSSKYDVHKNTQIRYDPIVPTLNKVQANKPDILIVSHTEKIIKIIDIAVFNKTEANNAKYDLLGIGFFSIYGYKFIIILIIITWDALLINRTVNNFQNNLHIDKKIIGYIEFRCLSKTAVIIYITHKFRV